MSQFVFGASTSPRFTIWQDYPPMPSPNTSPVKSNSTDSVSTAFAQAAAPRRIFSLAISKDGIELRPEREANALNNRVIRTFSNVSFAKVKFVGCSGYALSSVKQNYVQKGFTFENIKFAFAGASNSGLKENSCWFVEASAMEQNGFYSKLGDFSDLLKTGIGKLFCRIALCFGDSLPTITLQSDEFTDIQDVRNKKQQLYTDGAGIIVQSKMEQIAAMLKLNYVPSVIQVRVAGCKGCLVAYPDDCKLIKDLRKGNPKTAVFVRKSMIKFKSSYWTIDVLNWSKQRRTNLNRMLLSCVYTLLPAEHQADFEQVRTLICN